MAFYPISALVNAVTSTLVCIIVIKRNPLSGLNRSFGYFALSVAFWAYSYFFWQISKSAESALFWCRVLMAGAIFIPPTFLHFSITLIGKRKKYLRAIMLWYLFSVFFLALDFTTLFVKDVRPRLFFSYWPTAGIAYTPFLLMFISLIIYSHVLMFRSYRQFSGVKRNQIKYVLLGTTIGFLGGATNYFLWYDIPIPPVGNVLVAVYVFLVAYAIVKYRLMDITLVWRQVLMFASYFIVASAFPFLPMIFGYRYPVSLGVIMAFFLLVAPFFYSFLQRFSQPFVDDVLLRGKYSYWKSMSNFWKKKRVVYTSSQLGDTIVQGVTKLMGLENAVFFGLKRDRDVFVPLAYVGMDDIFDSGQAEIANTLYPDDSLPVYLDKAKSIVFRDELAAKKDVENREEIITEMDEIKAYVILPLFTAGRLTAILSLGCKKNKELFHKQDMGLLRELAAMAENHLSHTVFFENSLFFSGSTAHDIRSPLKSGIIDEYLYTISRGLKNPVYKNKAEEALNNLKENIVRFRAMTDRMVDSFEVFKRFVMDEQKPQEIDYKKKINKTAQSWRERSREKGIEFNVVLPLREVFVYADPIDVDRILNELIANAYKYTKKGKIEIEVRQENSEVVLTVIRDTGRGIAEENLDEIWDLFKRVASNSASGSGIGLASARQLVETNGGKIWAESEKGKGSRFFFTLPAKEING